LVLNALREWKLVCPKGDLGSIFPNGVGKVESYANLIDRGFGPIQIAADVVAQKLALDAAGEPVIVSVGQIWIWSSEAIPERRWRRSTAPPLRLQGRYERRDRAGPPVAGRQPGKNKWRP
jgi:integrase